MVKIGDALYLSSVEIRKPTTRYPQLQDGYDRDTGEGVGHLFKLDLKGNLLAQMTLGEGTVYHPGGIDFDGKSIWVPVAEYRPNIDYQDCKYLGRGEALCSGLNNYRMKADSPRLPIGGFEIVDLKVYEAEIR